MEVKFNDVVYLDKINNITYNFEENKITSIIGTSGSGKTLLSYLMTGLIIPKEGTITIGDNVIDKNQKKLKNIRKRIGYVFQNPEEQFFTTSVKEEIEFSLKNYEYKIEERTNKVLELLKMIGLEESFLNRNPHTLSGGEKEKLAIIIALSLDPEILILDEPTIYLDNKSLNELIELLLKLKNKYNKTIILISNNINFINKITDNIIMINKGKIILNIKLNQLIDNVDLIKKNGVEIPKILEFISMIEKKKNIKLTYTDDIDKLVSEIKNNV